MRAFICPRCGATLSIHDEEREFAFCEYCGQKIDLADYRTVHTERYVDEAKIKEAEAHIREVELAEAKFEQKQREKKLVEEKAKFEEQQLIKERKKRRNFFIGLCVVLFPVIIGGDTDSVAIVFLILFVVWIILFGILPIYDNRVESVNENGCRIPRSIKNIENKTHSEVAIALRKAGFTDIKTVNMHDVKFGLLTKPGKVESIQIEGQDIVSEDCVVKAAYRMLYEPDVSIVITYHGR